MQKSVGRIAGVCQVAVAVLALSNGSVTGGETNMATLSTAPVLQPHGEAEVSIESRFGKAIINSRNPKMTALWLRNPDGSLPSESMLSGLENASISRRREGTAGSDSIAFVHGAYTYVVDPRAKQDTEFRAHLDRDLSPAFWAQDSLRNGLFAAAPEDAAAVILPNGLAVRYHNNHNELNKKQDCFSNSSYRQGTHGVHAFAYS